MHNKVILDTNIWISLLIGKRIGGNSSVFDKHDIVLIVCDKLKEEILITARRPKFRKYFSEKEIENLMNWIDTNTENIPLASRINICRDPKDDYLLALALDSQADYLLSGDEDLLSIKSFGKTRIIKFSDFVKEYM
jgi:putative PIN family toxin of toxin-antitoxin system